MQSGICNLSMMPLRKEPSHKSEMISQLLFGDVYKVLEFKGDWAEICMAYDGYIGYISTRQIEFISDDEYELMNSNDMNATTDIVQVVYNKTKNITQGIFIGSSLPEIKDEIYTLAGDTYLFRGNLTSNISYNNDRETIIEENIRKFIHAPYLWGGRAPFGIDCSGFVQIIYKLCGIKLTRDAGQQSKLGEPVHLFNDAVPGDLMFFDNEEQIITHTGIYLGNNKIVHASGMVRIDHVDSKGIFDNNRQLYTHNMKMIRKINS